MEGKETPIVAGKETPIVAGKAFLANKKQRQWSVETAAFLSFLFPGWGQIYRGQVWAGIIWLVVTIVCYIFSISLGLFVHIICTLEAAYVKPEK
jgi:TM2 domain-containing membrane protein YozV